MRTHWLLVLLVLLGVAQGMLRGGRGPQTGLVQRARDDLEIAEAVFAKLECNDRGNLHFYHKGKYFYDLPKLTYEMCRLIEEDILRARVDLAYAEHALQVDQTRPLPAAP